MLLDLGERSAWYSISTSGKFKQLPVCMTIGHLVEALMSKVGGVCL
jgi:hypothetical protein